MSELKKLKDIRGGYKSLITQFLTKLNSIPTFEEAQNKLISTRAIKLKIDKTNEEVLNYLSDENEIVKEIQDSVNYDSNVEDLIMKLEALSVK